MQHGLGYDVVTQLTNNLHNTYRKIFFDNFFTSIPLLEDLYIQGLYGCGTVRNNRKGFPADLKKPRDVKKQRRLASSSERELKFDSISMEGQEVRPSPVHNEPAGRHSTLIMA